MKRLTALALAVAAMLSCAALTRQAPDKLELRRLEFKNWPYANSTKGSGQSSDEINRNQQKNRPWTASKAKVEWTVGKFTDTAAMYDLGLQITGQQRKDLLLDNPSKLQAVNKFENRLVSVTGYLGCFYSVGPESANYGSDVYHDWHLELFEHPVYHSIQVGDETPIVCEVTRFTERKLYDKGVRLQKLAAFVRTGGNGQVQYIPTGHPGHRIRVTGYLLWDDSHGEPSVDVGPAIQSAPKGRYHHPWRQTAWEIHPITAIEDLGAPK